MMDTSPETTTSTTVRTERTPPQQCNRSDSPSTSLLGKSGSTPSQGANSRQQTGSSERVSAPLSSKSLGSGGEAALPVNSALRCELEAHSSGWNVSALQERVFELGSELSRLDSMIASEVILKHDDLTRVASTMGDITNQSEQCLELVRTHRRQIRGFDSEVLVKTVSLCRLLIRRRRIQEVICILRSIQEVKAWEKRVHECLLKGDLKTASLALSQMQGCVHRFSKLDLVPLTGLNVGILQNALPLHKSFSDSLRALLSQPVLSGSSAGPAASRLEGLLEGFCLLSVHNVAAAGVEVTAFLSSVTAKAAADLLAAYAPQEGVAGEVASGQTDATTANLAENVAILVNCFWQVALVHCWVSDVCATIQRRRIAEPSAPEQFLEYVEQMLKDLAVGRQSLWRRMSQSLIAVLENLPIVRSSDIEPFFHMILLIQRFCLEMHCFRESALRPALTYEACLPMSASPWSIPGSSDLLAALEARCERELFCLLARELQTLRMFLAEDPWHRLPLTSAHHSDLVPPPLPPATLGSLFWEFSGGVSAGDVPSVRSSTIARRSVSTADHRTLSDDSPKRLTRHQPVGGRSHQAAQVVSRTASRGLTASRASALAEGESRCGSPGACVPCCVTKRNPFEGWDRRVARAVRSAAPGPAAIDEVCHRGPVCCASSLQIFRSLTRLAAFQQRAAPSLGFRVFLSSLVLLDVFVYAVATLCSSAGFLERLLQPCAPSVGCVGGPNLHVKHLAFLEQRKRKLLRTLLLRFRALFTSTSGSGAFGEYPMLHAQRGQPERGQPQRGHPPNDGTSTDAPVRGEKDAQREPPASSELLEVLGRELRGFVPSDPIAALNSPASLFGLSERVTAVESAFTVFRVIYLLFLPAAPVDDAQAADHSKSPTRDAAIALRRTWSYSEGAVLLTAMQQRSKVLSELRDAVYSQAARAAFDLSSFVATVGSIRWDEGPVDLRPALKQLRMYLSDLQRRISCCGGGSVPRRVQQLIWTHIGESTVQACIEAVAHNRLAFSRDTQVGGPAALLSLAEDFERLLALVGVQMRRAAEAAEKGRPPSLGIEDAAEEEEAAGKKLFRASVDCSALDGYIKAHSLQCPELLQWCKQHSEMDLSSLLALLQKALPLSTQRAAREELELFFSEFLRCIAETWLP